MTQAIPLSDDCLSEQVLYSTVRLECDKPAGKSAGTAFFYRFVLNEEKHIPVLVTNKHVIKGADDGRFDVHYSSTSDKSAPLGWMTVETPNFQSRWIHHPSDDVDLCILPIGPLMDHLRKGHKELFYRSLEYQFLPTNEDIQNFRPIEDVCMIGYPRGIWDSANNMPLVRRGITASAYARDFQGRKEFVVDIAAFKGSSGSPVFILNDGNYIDRKGNTVLAARFFLLGILYGGPEINAKGELQIMPIPGAGPSDVISKIPLNLGFVIKSSVIEEMRPILVDFWKSQPATRD